MAWLRSTINGLAVHSETSTLPASAINGYSSVITKFKPNDEATHNVTFLFNASAVTGANLDIALYGSTTEAGTSKYLLKDAVVADITATGEVAGVVDLNAYPSPYYFLAWLAAGDESANTITAKIIAVAEDE